MLIDQSDVHRNCLKSGTIVVGPSMPQRKNILVGLR